MPYTNFSQQYFEYDYKELTIPAQRGRHAIEKNALHLWPRGSHLLIALPNPDGLFTGTLFLPHQGDLSFEGKSIRAEKVLAFFKQEFPDALDLAQSQAIFNLLVGRLAMVKISPWVFNDKILLVGDAAHGIGPFYGQGLNCSFEDCISKSMHR